MEKLRKDISLKRTGGGGGGEEKGLLSILGIGWVRERGLLLDFVKEFAPDGVRRPSKKRGKSGWTWGQSPRGRGLFCISEGKTVIPEERDRRGNFAISWRERGGGGGKRWVFGGDLVPLFWITSFVPARIRKKGRGRGLSCGSRDGVGDCKVVAAMSQEGARRKGREKRREGGKGLGNEMVKPF